MEIMKTLITIVGIVLISYTLIRATLHWFKVPIIRTVIKILEGWVEKSAQLPPDNERGQELYSHVNRILGTLKKIINDIENREK